MPLSFDLEEKKLDFGKKTRPLETISRWLQPTESFVRAKTQEPAETYLKEAQPAFKYFTLKTLMGKPKEEAVKKAETLRWADIVKESNPEYYKTGSYWQQLGKNFAAETAGDILDIGSRPSSYIIWGVAERALPPLAKAAFKKLPKKTQQFLTKEIFPNKDLETLIDKAYMKKARELVAQKKITPRMAGDPEFMRVGKAEIRNTFKKLRKADPEFNQILQRAIKTEKAMRQPQTVPFLSGMNLEKQNLINAISKVNPTLERVALEKMSYPALTKLAQSLKIPKPEEVQLEIEPEVPERYMPSREELGLGPTLGQTIKKLGGIAPHKKGMPGALREEYRTMVPLHLRSKEGVPLDEMADMLARNYPELGITDDRDLLFALQRERGATERIKRIKSITRKITRTRQPSVKKALREQLQKEKGALREVQRVGKKLAEPMPVGKVKPLIHRLTGLRRVGDIIEIEEGQIQRIRLRAEARGAKFGVRVGKEIGRERLATFKEAQRMKQRIQRALKVIHIDPKKPEFALDFAYMQQIEKLRDMAQVSKKSPLSSMTIDELEGLANQVRTLRRTGRQILQRKKKIEKLRFENLKRTLIANLGGVPPKVPILAGARKEPFGKALLEKQLRALRPLRFFDLLDGGKNFQGEHARAFYKAADLAHSNQVKGVNARKNAFKQLLKDHDIKTSWANQVKKVREYEFSNQECMFCYYALKNPEQLAAVMYGNRLSFDAVVEASKSLSANERAFADKFQTLVGEKYPQLRQAMIEAYNKDLGKVEKYFPLMRLSEYGSYFDELDEEALLRSVYRRKGIEKGFTISRKDIPVEYQKPVNMNAIDIGLRSIENQEHFINFIPLQRGWNRLLNDADYKGALINRVGSQGYRIVKKWVEAVLNPRSVYNAIEPLSTMLRRNASVVYLGFNVITMGKQFPSIAFALNEASPADIATAMKEIMSNYEETSKFIFERDPQVKRRMVERDIEELMQRIDKNLFLKTRNLLGEVAMKGIFAVDNIVVMSVWKSVFDKAIRKGMSELEAIDLAHTVFLNTQPQAAVKDLPDIYRSGELLKALTQFTNQLNQIYNMATYDVPYYAKKDPKSKTMRKIISVILSSYLIWQMTHGRFPKNAREFAEALSMSPLQSIPLVGGTMLYALQRTLGVEARWFGAGVPSLRPFEAFGELIATRKLTTALRKGGELASLAMGIPAYKPIERTVRGVGALMRGKTRDIRRTLWSPYMLREKEEMGRTPFILRKGKGKKGKLRF